MNTIDKYGDSHVVRAFITRNFEEVGYEFIDDVVTYLKNYAFAGARDLKVVSLPALTSIPTGCFMEAQISDATEIPWNNIQSISFSAFAGSSVIKDSSIVLSKATRINSAAFYNATGISNVVADEWADYSETSLPMLPNRGVFEGSSLQSISAAAFQGSIFVKSLFRNCKGLISVNLPVYNGGTDSMFQGCSAITKIELPKLKTLEDNYTFDGCSALEQVSLPAVTEISGMWTFNSCKSLTSVSIPSVKGKLGESTFRYCSSLASLDIPLVTELEDTCFCGTGFTSEAALNMPKVTRLSNYALSESKLKSFKSDVITAAGSNAFSYCSALTEVTLSKAEVIGGACFSYCASLRKVIIGGNITSINKSTFMACSVLDTVVLSGITSVPTADDTAFADATKMVTPAAEGQPPVGIVYVPDALVNSFKADSGWSALNIQPLSSYNE